MSTLLVLLGSAAGNIAEYANKQCEWQMLPKLWLEANASEVTSNHGCEVLTWDDNILTKLEKLFHGRTKVILVAGLGGSIGSNVDKLALLASKHGLDVETIVIKPFVFEGADKHQVAELVINNLLGHLSKLAIFDNEKILKWLGDGKTLFDGFEECNRQAVEYVNQVVAERKVFDS